MPGNATTDNPHHKRLEADVIDWLTGNGFMVESNTYHDRLPKSFSDRLRVMYNQTSLVVRTGADRLAIHRERDFAFLLEFKTICDPKWANLAVEALPLSVHVEKAKLGTRCLYVVRDVIPGREYEGCFWADKPIPADALFVPRRFQGTELERRMIAAFPRLEVRRPDSVNGSGDPYVRVKRETFNTFMFPDWRTAVLCGGAVRVTAVPPMGGGGGFESRPGD